MNIVNTLTLRHLKSHKKRSVLTVFAIIVSVAMVTAVFTSAISFVKFFQNATLAVDGNWHAKFQEANFVDNRSIYKNDKNIEEIRKVCTEYNIPYPFRHFTAVPHRKETTKYRRPKACL